MYLSIGSGEHLTLLRVRQPRYVLEVMGLAAHGPCIGLTPPFTGLSIDLMYPDRRAVLVVIERSVAGQFQGAHDFSERASFVAVQQPPLPTPIDR